MSRPPRFGGRIPRRPTPKEIRRREGKEKGALPGADDPAVVLDVELDGGKLWLVLANDSERPAFDVTVEFDGPLLGVGGEVDVTGLEIFDGLPILRSGREVRVFVDVARHFFAREEPTALRARVSWESRHGERFAQEFRHDLEIWKDFGEAG